jgi:hypothetical protein
LGGSWGSRCHWRPVRARQPSRVSRNLICYGNSYSRTQHYIKAVR